MEWTPPPRRLALVTGASAGIGAAFARLLARQGFDLALVARREDRLRALAAELHQMGSDVLVIREDLAAPGAVDRILEFIEARGRTVDVLINNAGLGLPGKLVSTNWADQNAMLQLMLVSVCELTHKVLPGMIERGYGRVVHIASLAGLVPGAAGHTLYAAVKSFLIKMAQSLHLETRGTGVEVCALSPGFTWTEFHDVSGTREMMNALPRYLWQKPEAVVTAGWAATEAGRAVVVPGGINRTVAFLAKLLPDDLALAIMRRNSHRIRKA